jgi:hypothetical protein
LIFFLSEQGFKACDRNQVIPIGLDQIDEFFFRTYARTDIIRDIHCAVDPRSTTVTWSMPGTPGRLWSYNWSRKKWSVTETGLKSVFTGFTANTSLEELDVLYPDGIDSIPYSLDATRWAGGQPMFFIVNNSDEVGTLTGSNLEMSIIIPPIEVEYGRRIRINGVYLDSDATTATVTVDARVRAGDEPKIRASSSMRASGRMPIRSNGRFNGFRVQIPAGEVWTYINGIKIDYEMEGIR